MFQRLNERGDVDKEHIIELSGEKARLFFLKEDSMLKSFFENDCCFETMCNLHRYYLGFLVIKMDGID